MSLIVINKLDEDARGTHHELIIVIKENVQKGMIGQKWIDPFSKLIN